MTKYIYSFHEGNATMKHLLGGKGANLAEMTQIGLPIPPGFILTTEACVAYYEQNQTLHPDLKTAIRHSMKQLESETQQLFGSTSDPLLISVRSGAAQSMPGMMDTLLNLGMNDSITEALAQDQPFLAYDLYRRLIQMFGNVVKNIPMHFFDTLYQTTVVQDDVASIQKLVYEYKLLYESETGVPFEQDPYQQLYQAIEAVFKSWNNERAIYYRKMNAIHDLKGTAVNIQQMVFGNRSDNSATGVCFSRNPATGEPGLFGEMLWNAQGEDIVAGTHTPLPIDTLNQNRPEMYQELVSYAQLLEQHYKDMQDIEFTIENDTLFILQTRNGKRTPQAALQIAYDLVQEGLIDRKEAMDRIDDTQINASLHANFDAKALESNQPLGKGLPASPGAASGHIAFTKDKVVEWVEHGKNALLVRAETSPDDIEGMHLAEGILTSKGGMTSHAAVVTRGMGKPCIVGCSDIHFPDDTHVIIGKKTFSEGDILSINGSTGFVYESALPLEKQGVHEILHHFIDWAREQASFAVYANADTPEDAQTALQFQAQGIGLVRTEHMFFEHERIQAVREMILSDTPEERKKALDKLIPYQKNDFKALFEIMQSRPLTIRYLDPPLHEFMPSQARDIHELAKSMNISEDIITARIASLHEFNPMMGHRGSRLAITYPEIYDMQTQAILEAALEVEKKGITVDVSFMLPLIGDIREYRFLHEHVHATIQNFLKNTQHTLHYHIGTMIELPRACLIADQIAEIADFISFGTNDLTQMTFGFSRDDTHHFMQSYYDHSIYTEDPFATLDQEGVGYLIRIAVEKARSRNPHIKIGVCGEHGGDPKSIQFFKTLDLDYVSCSPYRVPLAIMSAAKDSI